jgi:hypothetical protein
MTADLKAIAEANPWVYIRRQWNDWRVGRVRYQDLWGLRWDWVSGGVNKPAPQPFIYGYTMCDCVEGDVAHYCTHGTGPHRIKVCVVKVDNDPRVYAVIREMAGEKPDPAPRCRLTSCVHQYYDVWLRAECCNLGLRRKSRQVCPKYERRKRPHRTG